MKQVATLWRNTRTLDWMAQMEVLRTASNFIFPDAMNTQSYTAGLMLCVLDKDREGMIALYDEMEREGIIDYMRTLVLTKRKGDPLDAYDKTLQSSTDDD